MSVTAWFSLHAGSAGRRRGGPHAECRRAKGTGQRDRRPRHRVHEAVDEAFVLANDGAIRWLGEPVGKIDRRPTYSRTARPRSIADEQLTGADLEKVQRRARSLARRSIVKKLLGPLEDLGKGRRTRRHRPGDRLPSRRGAWRPRALPRRRRNRRPCRRKPARLCANSASASAPITFICRDLSSRRRARSPRNSGRCATAASKR